jgi:predicted CXXCH cytochrome family protein
MKNLPPEPVAARPPISIGTWTLVVLAAAALAGCGEPEPEADHAPAVNVLAQPAARAVVEPPAPRPTEPLAPGTSCVSGGCHSTFATAPFVHGVVRSSPSCSVCHEDDQGGHVYPVRRPGSAGCTFCHDTVIGQRVHQHAATDVDCLTCHDPHTSEHRSLLLADSTASLCATCHPAGAASVPHAPFASGECAACHEPHESDFPGLLRGGEGPAHCDLCHEATSDAIDEAQWVHEPARQDCLICHQPHGSDHRGALAQPIEQNCFSCHPDIEQTTAGVEAPHGALTMSGRCANCHDAHASDHPKLLREREDALCLECHAEPVTALDGRIIPDMTPSIRDREFLHGPIRAGSCSGCHSAHGGSHARLLRAHFTEAFYTSFDLSQYALCFECHEDALVTEERTTALTSFRDGDLNLHYVHVHREEKGRTCRACHELHGSDNPAHVAESVPFGSGGWALPIGFEQTATGGSCSPGCHKPMGYDRDVPVLGGDP